MKESHFLSYNMFWENAVGLSEMVNARAFKPLPLCSAAPENLLVEISGAIAMTGIHFYSKNVFWENVVGTLRNGKC